MGTKYQGSDAEVRALDTYIKLTRAAQTVLDRTNRHLADHGLTTSQFGVLEALHHLGALSQIDVARKLLMSTANITTVMQNLEKAGYIRRERDPRDQRDYRDARRERDDDDDDDYRRKRKKRGSFLDDLFDFD